MNSFHAALFFVAGMTIANFAQVTETGKWRGFIVWLALAWLPVVIWHFIRTVQIHSKEATPFNGRKLSRSPKNNENKTIN